MNGSQMRSSTASPEKRTKQIYTLTAPEKLEEDPPFAPFVSSFGSEPVDQVLANLERQMDQMSIPGFHARLFMEIIREMPINNQLELAFREREALRNGASIVQVVQKSIFARENCILKLKSEVNGLANDLMKNSHRSFNPRVDIAIGQVLFPSQLTHLSVSFDSS